MNSQETIPYAGVAHVTVMPSGDEFCTEGNETILEGALRAGVPLSYGCSGGSCGLCKAKIISGEIQKTRFHDYVRTEADKRDGLVLMCSNSAIADVVIEAGVAEGAEEIPLQQVSATVKLVTVLMPEMVLLHLRMPRTSRLRFLAGQSVSVMINQSLNAVLPIASCPCDDHNILLHVQRKPDDLFSDYVFNQLKNNEVVELEGPQGSFVLQKVTTRPLHFFAFDTGFAPIKSLVEHAMSLESGVAIYLHWIGSSDASIYLPNIGRAWADALDNFYYSQVVAGFDLTEFSGQQTAFFNALLQGVLKDQPDVLGSDIYIAGSEAAVKLAVQFFGDAGLPKAQLFSDCLIIDP
jgi:CDP-4-dehydro-6-deoxyglucose reductase